MDGARHRRHDSSPAPDNRDPSRLSKFLALVLRHRAPQFGLRPDEEGFVSLPDLLNVIHEQDGLGWVQREDLEAVAGNHVRQRFEIRGDLIRATYGHSFSRAVRYAPVEPPEELFIGLTRMQLENVRVHGLQPEGRQYVHLSDDREEALEMCHRKDPDGDVVTIRAREAAAAGIAFHHPAAGLFLSGPIPVDYLDLAVAYGRRLRRGRSRR